MNDIEAKIRDNFFYLWPQHVDNFVSLLIFLRNDASCDLDDILILAIVGNSTFKSSKKEKSFIFEEWEKCENSLSNFVNCNPINIQSISDYSGIPRETVRRKINNFIDKGWVFKNSRGHLRATASVRLKLGKSTDRSIRYLSEMQSILNKG